jgi:hypothetical protein
MYGLFRFYLYLQKGGGFESVIGDLSRQSMAKADYPYGFSKPFSNLCKNDSILVLDSSHGFGSQTILVQKAP